MALKVSGDNGVAIVDSRIRTDERIKISMLIDKPDPVYLLDLEGNEATCLFPSGAAPAVCVLANKGHIPKSCDCGTWKRSVI